jgi:hypothetical protein
MRSLCEDPHHGATAEDFSNWGKPCPTCGGTWVIFDKPAGEFDRARRAS